MHSRIRSFRTHRELERLQFDFFPVGHKEGELYVRMLNKQAAEPWRTLSYSTGRWLACPCPIKDCKLANRRTSTSNYDHVLYKSTFEGPRISGLLARCDMSTDFDWPHNRLTNGVSF
jgi:hypothetical protein